MEEVTITFQEYKEALAYQSFQYEKRLQEAQTGEARHIYEAISPELVAIRDIISYIPEKDRRRIERRIDRIFRRLYEAMDNGD